MLFQIAHELQLEQIEMIIPGEYRRVAAWLLFAVVVLAAVRVVIAAVETAVALEAVAVVTWPRVIEPDPVG